MKKYAVVDIGTNSARLMVAHVGDGNIVADYKTLRLIRVGEGMVGKRQDRARRDGTREAGAA